MKKFLMSGLACLFLFVVVYTIQGGCNGFVQGETMSYDSDVNMKSTLAEIQSEIRNMYSASRYSDVKVSTTYRTFGVVCDNLSQDRLVEQWNTSNPNKRVSGACGIVANTMLLRKYMQLTTGKLPKTYSDVEIFNAQMVYAWGSGKVFRSDDRSGTTQNQNIKRLNYYLDTYESNKYTANGDSTGLWSTCRSYLVDKIRPVLLHLNGSDTDHEVMCTAGYIETVTYNTKVLNWSVSHTDNYKIVRICNGWEDSLQSSWNKTTNSYVFFDCVENLIKLK